MTDCFGFVWMRRVNRLSLNVECARYVALFAAVIFLAIYIFFSLLQKRFVTA